MSNIRHITVPGGFVAAGVTCGIKASGRPDLAILAGREACSAAIVTTSNQIVGAPILYDREILPKGYGKIRGIVVNSGCSNVCTGKPGLKDAAEMARRTAKHLGCKPEEVLVASTGVIGQRLPMPKIRAGIDDAAGELSPRNDEALLHAIMTTDTRPKYAVVMDTVGGTTIRVAGVVKGAGMIEPNLATMISLITTDAKIAPSLLARALKQAIGTTFNAVTVDSDQSTSDIVAVLASGAAGGRSIAAGSKEFAKFAALLTEVCRELARSVAADGEGAEHLIAVTVRGARNEVEARTAAKSIANSPLVKTAVHGADPNWGRIAMAVGKCPRPAVRIDPQTLTIRTCGVRVFAKGGGVRFDEAKVSQLLQAPEVAIDVDLGQGKSAFTAWTCDLTREYITINADYTT